MAKKVTNATALRNELLATFAGVQDGSIDTQTADSLARVSSRIISSASLQLRYALATGAKPNIPFLK